MGRQWLLACMLLSMAMAVRAYSSGAPAAACARIYPEGHSGTSLSLSSSPFVLDISQLYNQLGNIYYTPGYSYTLNLGGGNFRGFLIQARSSVSGTPLGKFSVGGDGSQRLSQCSPPESAVTHTSNSVKNSVSLTWTAPAAKSGPIVFIYAVVVQNSAGVSTFYATLNTSIIPEGCVEPQYLNGTTCVTSCPSYYYGNYTTRLCVPLLSSSDYVAAFNATSYDVKFLNTTPANTTVFGFTLYFNPTLPIGTPVVISISGNVGPTGLAADYFGFTTLYYGSTYTYSFPYFLNSPSDYILTDQIYYIPRPSVSTFQFNLQVIPYIDYTNVGVTIIDICQANPCYNGGTCVYTGGSNTTCRCAPGFKGPTCSNDINYCTPTTCRNGGTCYDGYGTYTNCTCARGFNGTTCSNDIIYCNPTTCLNGGTCYDGYGTYTICACATGFNGRNCSNEIKYCTPTKCRNGGTCVEGYGRSTSCSCAVGFSGSNCNTELPFCTSTTCLNGGTCYDGFGEGDGPLTSCSCAPGFTGNNCSTDLSFCTPTTCLNGGDCVEGYGTSVSCICPQSAVGAGCEIHCEMAPRISVQPESVSTYLNSQVTLNCQVLGCPSPHITWFRDSVAVSDGPYLVIPMLAPSDRGFYMCTAVNKHGSVSSNEARLSVKGLYQYSAHLELNVSATQEIADKLSNHLAGRFVLNNSGNIIFSNISYSGYTIDALITVAANDSFDFNFVINELYNLLLVLKYLQTTNTSIQRFDGCPLDSTCTNKYLWPESEIGTTYSPYSCIQRRCGGTYSSGGHWEPVVATCSTDYVLCALSELEYLLSDALNSTEVGNQLLASIDNLLNTNHDTIYQNQGAARLFNILNYYSNNAIINQTREYVGEKFAIKLEDINVSSGCFAARNFSVNLGSVDMAVMSNTTIKQNSIGSSDTENTTASVHILPLYSNNCSKTESSVYRLIFYTFLQNTLFPSPEQDKKGFKLGSIIISIGGSAANFAEKLDFSFQVVKGATDAQPVQWVPTYKNDSYQVGMWSTNDIKLISKENNAIITETELKNLGQKAAVYQANFGILLDLNPGGVDCPAADILSVIGTITSIVSLLFFVATYLSSRPLRRSEHGQVLINMSCALLCLYITFLVAANVQSVPVLCGISAALVHYFMLVYFMWTAAEAVFLYIKLVKILGHKINHFSFKCGLISWMVPLGIVIVSAGAGYRYYYNSNYCRASGLPFYLGFIVPFLAIYVFNWVIFIMVMASLCRNSARSTSVTTSNATGGNSHTLRHVLIAAGLALVLGLGWGFGLAASSHNINALACTFQFLFSVFVSCQGFLLLFFHGIRNKDAKKVWRSWIGLRSKSYPVTVNVTGEGKIQSNDQIMVMRDTPSNDDSSVPLDVSNTEKLAATDQSVNDEPSSLDSSPLVDEESATIAAEEKVAPKKTFTSFMSLSLLRKNATGGFPSFRSDSRLQCAKLAELDEDYTPL